LVDACSNKEQAHVHESCASNVTGGRRSEEKDSPSAERNPVFIFVYRLDVPLISRPVERAVFVVIFEAAVFTANRAISTREKRGLVPGETGSNVFLVKNGKTDD
jgi:hypothetical protein